MGRTSIRTDQMEVEILERLADGEGLWRICSDEHMPARGTVLRWAATDDAFCDKYARAMMLGVDAQVDDMDRVARDGGRDIVRMDMGDGVVIERVDHEHISRSKLIVDAIKWKASKIAPKKYGDKLSQEITGANGGPVESRHEIVFVKPGEKA